MSFINKIKYFICSFIAFLGFGLSLDTLNAMDYDYINYAVFYKYDIPSAWIGTCNFCSRKIKDEYCFVPYKTDEYGSLDHILNQVCLACLKEKVLIPYLQYLIETSNTQYDYVEKAYMSIVEGNSKYLIQDPYFGRPLCIKCGNRIILIKDDVIIISKDENEDAHVHKECLESVFGTNIDNIYSIYNQALKFADPPVVNIKALANKVWPQ